MTKNVLPFFVVALVSCGSSTSQSQFFSTQGPGGLHVVSGSFQKITIGDALAEPLVVLALDENGKPVSNASIQFSLEHPDSLETEFSPNPAFTGPDGIARTYVNLGHKAGEGTVLAEWGPNDQDDPKRKVFFKLESLPGRGSQFVVISGGGQCQIQDRLFDDLVVQFTDSYGNGIPGETLEVNAPHASFDSNGEHTEQFVTDDSGSIHAQLRADTVGQGILLSDGYDVTFTHIPSSMTGKTRFHNSDFPRITADPSTINWTSGAVYSIRYFAYGGCALQMANMPMQLFIDGVYNRTIYTDSRGFASTEYSSSAFPNVTPGHPSFLFAYLFYDIPDFGNLIPGITTVKK